MLSAFPMEKEDILEVASIAVHFETHFPTASKALLDKCASLLVSTMHTAEDVARFAEQVQGPGTYVESDHIHISTIAVLTIPVTRVSDMSEGRVDLIL